MFFPLRDYQPSGITPYVTYTLLTANVLMFLYQLILSNDVAMSVGRQLISENELLIFRYGFIPCRVFAECSFSLATSIEIQFPAWVTMFSSMFLHGDLMHLAGNMLYLWIFGDNVEASFGHVKFLAFYLICGVAAALAQAVMELSSGIPMIGASGAISGVLAAYMFMYPRAKVLTFVWLFIFFMRTVLMPASVILGIWFLMQLISALASSGGVGGGVAFMAHIGGFIAGAVLFKLFQKQKEEAISSPW